MTESKVDEAAVEQPAEGSPEAGDKLAARKGEKGNAPGRTGARVPTIGGSEGVSELGSELLDAIFLYGALTAEQAECLVPRGVGRRRARQALSALTRSQSKSGSGRLAVRTPRTPRYAPEGATGRWRYVYCLDEAGLDYVARRRDLHPSVASSLYKQVLDEARIDHALLRNEFYAWLCKGLRRQRELGAQASGHLCVNAMWAESGMTPMELSPGPQGGRRYLNPDGLFEVSLSNDPSYTLSAFIEADTGSEDMPWQVASHANKYAEYLLGRLREMRREDSPGTTESPPLLSAAGLPSVLWLSPNARRSDWVRDTIRDNGLKSSTTFYRARQEFREAGLKLPALFQFTNLEWLKAEGILGEAYWSLGSEGLRGIF